MWKRVSTLVSLGALAGCATGADDIAPSYISPIAYENYTCEQLAEEAQTVSARAAQAAGVQNKARTNDAIMTTVGVVVFWPTLFLIKGNGTQAAEVARLKGEMEAIQTASIRKKCRIEFQRDPAPPPKAASSSKATPQNKGASPILEQGMD